MTAIAIDKELCNKIALQTLSDSRPHHKDYHLINSGREPLLFLANGSKLIRMPSTMKSPLQKALHTHPSFLLEAMLEPYIPYEPQYIDELPIQNPATHALSLAIAQKCNLGCNYCYAAQGQFGEAAKTMDLKTAKQAIDFLLKDKKEGDSVQISFMGGEPLMNRKGIQEATSYASSQAGLKKVKVNFSITTNGTLIREEDIPFFEQNSFAVTISLDGAKEAHDQLRPLKNGKGSFDLILQNIKPLLQHQSQMQVSARITVTPQNMKVSETLQSFVDMGFHSVGLSPLLKAHDQQNELTPDQLNHLLSEMIECGLTFEKAILSGQKFPFLNMINAYKEIENQTHKPYPCGAGAGYMGVSATGELSACHRFVNDPEGSMGSLENGIDTKRQNEWLHNRHVLHQAPCNQCWARFLCGGGCHHEVIGNGRTACDFIRGWLSFCLQSYSRIHKLLPAS
jgi:uncharacterized protein